MEHAMNLAYITATTELRSDLTEKCGFIIEFYHLEDRLVATIHIRSNNTIVLQQVNNGYALEHFQFKTKYSDSIDWNSVAQYMAKTFIDKEQITADDILSVNNIMFDGVSICLEMEE